LFIFIIDAVVICQRHAFDYALRLRRRCMPSLLRRRFADATAADDIEAAAMPEAMLIRFTRADDITPATLIFVCCQLMFYTTLLFAVCFA